MNNEIKCPNCGKIFKIDEGEYDSIVKQIRDKEFDKEITLRDKQHELDKENSLKLKLDNDMIQFTKNGTPIGWWDGNDFHTGNIVVEVNERAQFGNFAFTPRSDGSLMLLKVKEA